MVTTASTLHPVDDALPRVTLDGKGRYHDTVCMSDILTTKDVAVRLHITPRQVQRLVARGELLQPARGVLDTMSVDRYVASAQGPRRVPWTPPTAWAAIALLSGTTPTWLGQSQTSRLRTRLRTLTPDRLVERTRARADIARYTAHRATIPRLRPGVIEPASDGLGLAASADTTLDGYVPSDELDTLVATHGLIKDLARGQVTLRTTSMDAAVVRDIAGRGVLAALDLATSLNPREHRAGITALQVYLDRYHDA